jgi:hypothetical protein
VKFKLGQCVATRNALALMEVQGVNPLHLLMRHANGDDGDLSEHDKLLNVDAIASGKSRIFSAYNLSSGDRIWVITEWDRSVTTILLPDDY